MAEQIVLPPILASAGYFYCFFLYFLFHLFFLVLLRDNLCIENCTKINVYYVASLDYECALVITTSRQETTAWPPKISLHPFLVF